MMARDVTTMLLLALHASFPGFGGVVRFDSVTSRSWASVTFKGARHQVCLTLQGDGATQSANTFLDGLDAAEFELPGHILADVVLAGKELSTDGLRAHIRLEALTVEDC